jgi:hypothetical protein
LSFHGAGSALAAHSTENFLAETQSYAGLSLCLDAQDASDGIHLASFIRRELLNEEGGARCWSINQSAARTASDQKQEPPISPGLKADYGHAALLPTTVQFSLFDPAILPN